MKIALCMECPLEDHGGIEVLVRELIRGLHSSFDLFIVSNNDWNELRNTEFGNYLHGGLRYDPNSDKNPQAQEIIKWGKANGIDLFHFHHGTYGWGSRLLNQSIINQVSAAGFRCVSTNHGAFALLDFVGSQRPLWYKLASLCLCWPAKLRQVAAVEWEATVSMHDWHAVRRWFFPLRGKFIQIYHSILNGREEYNPDKKNIILCLGTIGARKGQEHLAEAFGMIAKRHPEWRLVIAGRHADPVIAQKMLDAIKRHGIENQVDIYKDVPDSQAKDLLSRAAIFAMPSVAEGLGLSLQEAMFYGAACIGSSVGGITDMLEHERTGLLVQPADTNALAQGLERLIKDPLLRERLAGVGRASIPAKGMTKQAMCQRHVQLYNNI